MPFCPKCKSEFIEGIKVCNECGEELVAELPEEEVETEQEFEWVKVDNFGYDYEAGMITELLHSAGIPVEQKSYINDVFTFRYPKGIDIMVPVEYSEQAAEIIRAYTDEKKEKTITENGEAQSMDEVSEDAENTENGRMDARSRFRLIAIIILTVMVLLPILIRICGILLMLIMPKY